MIISLFQQSGGGGAPGQKIGITPPTVTASGLVYDGTAQSPTIGPYNTDAVTVAYTPQTNAGTYTVTIALKDKSKYVWLDTYDSENKIVNWSIAKATGTSALDKIAVELGEDESDTVTVTRDGDGEIIATSSDTTVCTVSVSGNVVTISDAGEGTATVSISVAAGTNYEAVAAKTVVVEVSYMPEIVTWANGTDEQIVKMCQASDNGKLNLYDYWNIGDERTVSLSAMETGDYVSETHNAEDVTMVIVDKHGYQIVGDKSLCAFTIQQKHCLSVAGIMNTTATNSGSWAACARRSWCNDIYYNAIPSSLRSIFKQVVIKTSNGSSIIESNDYIFLPAPKEIIYSPVSSPSNGQSNTNEWRTLFSWIYYSSNSISEKKLGNNGSKVAWWERSPAIDSSKLFCARSTDSSRPDAKFQAQYAYGLAPAGCIGSICDGTIKIPSWSEASDDEIVDLVTRSDNGELNLSDYWNIGDERVVSLSAMNAVNVSETHAAQDVILVLCDANNSNYIYTTPINGRTYCNFVVQQKNSLIETGYMNSTNTNIGTWQSSSRRTWCNNEYRNAIPSTLINIFKQVKVKTISEYNSSTIAETNDYFFLPAARELFDNPNDNSAYSNQYEWNALSVWSYYKSKNYEHRIKRLGNTGSSGSWWERSPYRNNNQYFLCVGTSVNMTYDSGQQASNSIGIAPCGCI